jgi:hypothetical protein
MTIFHTSLALAGDMSERESLRELPGVEVVVGGIPPDLRSAGISEEQIRTSVELILRSSGIGILEKMDLVRAPSAPYLYVQLHGVKTNAGAYAYSARVRLIQVVSLIHRADERAFAATWDNIDGGFVGSAQVKSIVGDVETMVKHFANEFLTVNPR